MFPRPPASAALFTARLVSDSIFHHTPTCFAYTTRLDIPLASAHLLLIPLAPSCVDIYCNITRDVKRYGASGTLKMPRGLRRSYNASPDYFDAIWEVRSSIVPIRGISKFFSILVTSCFWRDICPFGLPRHAPHLGRPLRVVERYPPRGILLSAPFFAPRRKTVIRKTTALSASSAPN